MLLPLFGSPIVGLAIGFLLMALIMNVFRRANPRRMNDRFRRLQVLSAAFMAFSHGSNDAQKTMGIMTLALVTAGVIPEFKVPLWVILLAATAITWAPRRVAGESSAPWAARSSSSTRCTASRPRRRPPRIIFTASRFGMPVSTTHVISSAILGVGSTGRLSAVRWGVARSIVTAWILTLPAAGLMAALAYLVLRPFI